MGYLDRQKTILQTLYDTNWEFFDGDKKEALESIEDYIKQEIIMLKYNKYLLNCRRN